MEWNGGWGKEGRVRRGRRVRRGSQLVERRTRKDGRLREKCSGRWARGGWRQERCARVVKDTWVRREMGERKDGRGGRG